MVVDESTISAQKRIDQLEGKSMEEILFLATAIALVVGGVVEAIKRATHIKKRYLPIVALIVGILVGVAAYFLEAEIGLRMWAGGIAGLMSVGLFETGKNIKGDDQE